MRIKSLIFFIILFCFGVGLLGFRLCQLQLSEGAGGSKGKGQFSIVPEKPQRGIIFDRNGSVLAASRQVDRVFAEPRRLSDPEIAKTAAFKLQQVTGIPGHEICRKIYRSSNPGYVCLYEDIDNQQRLKVLDSGIFGLGIQTDWRRYYPCGGLACHVVGFVGTDQRGLGGAEYYYNDELTGTKGEDILFVDVHRRPIGSKDRRNTLNDGLCLVLTIDNTIQQIARSVLLEQFSEYRAESAVAIVMEPYSGEVLAMVSLPDFDPSDLNGAEKSNLRNRALTDPFEPGSIFKPIAMAVALDSGIVGFNDVFYCEDGYYGKYRIGEWGNHKFGDLSVRKILVESSNVGMAKVGQKIGEDVLYEGLKLFGIGRKTGIDLGGEDAGLLRDVSKWSGYSITRIPYGYEVNVTAVQMARAYCVIANGGMMVRPRVLKAVVDNEGNIKKLKERVSTPGRIIKPEVAKWLRETALSDVVKEGTGKKAGIEKWQVFGKTGTAHISIPGQRGYDNSNYTASFVGGAPADDPAVVVLVSIRKPDKSLGKGYSGGRVAAEVVGSIIEETLEYLSNQTRRRLAME